MSRNRKWRVLCLAAIGVSFGLWALGFYLQARAAWLRDGEAVGAVYMLGGGGGDRVAGLDAWLDAGNRVAWILIPDETARHRWSRVLQRNLSTAEWRLRELEAVLDRYVGHPPGDGAPLPRVLLMPGVFTGTDREMESLAAFLAAHPGLGPIALVTSRNHNRRALNRARAYLPPEAIAGSIPGAPHWRNYAPWTVAVETAKLLRDQMKLSRAPLLHRAWWQNVRGDSSH